MGEDARVRRQVRLLKNFPDHGKDRLRIARRRATMIHGMRNLQTALFCAALLVGCAGSDGPSEQAAREAEFERSMRNVVLEGHFTVSGRGDESRLHKERYEIDKVVKIVGDLWTVHARIRYGSHDVRVPVPVKVLWAGDTPLISITDATIPGLGEAFTARVAFYRGRYSGMWQHGDVGGNQFGRIVPAEESPETP